VVTALVQLLILFLVVVVLPMVAWEARKRSRDQQLRSNPAKQVVIELRVPRELTETNKKMMDVWANLRSSFDPDSSDRREGLGKVTFLFDVHNRDGKQPILSCYLYCDKQSEAAVRRTLTNTFRAGDVELRDVKPKDDPRRYYVKLLQEEQKAAEGGTP
jgi:hypothetical protein